MDSRQKAQALILAGKVRVDGKKIDKPGHLVTEEAHFEVELGPQYVSRGGIKMAAALERFEIDVTGKICLDVGTSTGGFTDCLLQHGARCVHAVDTGSGQIDWKLRTDPRVILHERTNARYLTLADVGEQVDFIACDVSFISVTLLISPLAPLLLPSGDWIILVKPQFEVGRELVGKGGIVRDTIAHRQACEKVMAAMQDLGFFTVLIESPILGAEGNREFLLHATANKNQNRARKQAGIEAP